VKKCLVSILVTLVILISGSTHVSAEYPDVPNDLTLLKEKITKSLVVVKWSGNKKGVAFAGNYNLTPEQKNQGTNSLLVTNFSNLGEEINVIRSCFGASRSKDVTLEYLGKNYTGTCQTYNSDQSDLATINSSLNLPTLSLYDSYIPSAGQWVIVAYFAEGFGINFATSRIRLVNTANFVLGIDKFESNTISAGLVFNSNGNFLGVLTSYGLGSTPVNYLKVHGAPLQCQTQLKTAWTITNCPVSQDKIWVTLNPGQSTQTTPVPTVSPTPVAAPEVVEARNAALDAIAASTEAIDQIEIAKEECLSVSDSFDLDVQELYDSTNLSRHCESLDSKVNALTSKVLSINANQVKTKNDANKIIEQSNGFSEEADKITAQIQDITDELSNTERQFISIIKSQEPLESAEDDVINSWSSLDERLALLPKTSISTIKKSQNYKSALAIFLQISKVVSTKNELLEALYSVDKPSEMSSIVRKFSTLKINANQITSYKKLATSINKAIPKSVCSKGSLVLLPSKAGKCPNGFDDVPTQ
jgi:hypothetical protein